MAMRTCTRLSARLHVLVALQTLLKGFHIVRLHDLVLISEAPRSGLLSLAPVSAKELKKRAFQGVL